MISLFISVILILSQLTFIQSGELTPPFPSILVSSDSYTFLEPDSNCSCGELFTPLEKRVFKGQYIHRGEYPWLVGLIDLNNSDQKQDPFCFGSLINDRYVITSADCVYGKKAQNVGILLLGLDIYGNTTKLLLLSKFKIHGGFNDKYDHNIALLRLRGALDVKENDSNGVVPVCLPRLSMSDNSDFRSLFLVLVKRWQFKKAHDYPFLTFFGQMLVKSMNKENCTALYPNLLQATSLCVSRPQNHFLLSHNNEFFCHIAPGIPLMRAEWSKRSKSKYRLVGFGSEQSKCSAFGDPEKRTNVFTSIQEYLPWIFINTYDGSYCNT